MKTMKLLLAICLASVVAPLCPLDAAQPGEKLWEFQTIGAVSSSPAIGMNGTVYVASKDGALYALNGRTGQKLWAFPSGGYSSPTIGADGTVYVGSGNFYALNGATGQKLWEFQIGSSVYASPAIGADGTVYVGSWEGKVFALNGATGKQLWTFQTGSHVEYSLAIGADGMVYVGSWDKVYALNGATGQKLWEFQVSATGFSIGADGTVYVGGNPVYALNGANGQKLWEFKMGMGGLSSPTIGADGTVYVGSRDNILYALNGATGQKLWEFQTIDWVLASPTIGADGTVYVGSWEGKVFALNGATGRKSWEFQTGDQVWSSPAIGADGTVYVGSDDRKVYALYSSSVGGLAQSPWPRFGGDAQNTHRVNSPSSIRLLSLTVLKEGNQSLIEAGVFGKPTPQVQWFFNGAAVPGGTNATLILSTVTRAMEGTYWLVASNALGQATSAPTAAVVSNVDPERFVGLQWPGHPESGLSIESTDWLGSEVIWQTRTNYPPASTEQRFVELAPAAATGFYRLSGSGAPPVITQVGFVNGWRYATPAGTQHRIEYTAAATGWTNWQLLNNLVLPASPYLFLDDPSLGGPARVYRTTPVP